MGKNKCGVKRSLCFKLFHPQASLVSYIGAKIAKRKQYKRGGVTCIHPANTALPLALREPTQCSMAAHSCATLC